MADAPSIADALDTVRRRIAKAERLAGRAPGSVVLTCVSKTQAPERIDQALAAGQRVFGENRVQEAEGRWAERDRTDLTLRMIGPLQSNKASAAVALFDAIETVDRPSLAKALAEAIQTQGRAPELLVQVNTGEEPQKAGVAPADLDGFIDALRKDYGLGPAGLMCIPPVEEEPAMHFALLRRMADRNGLSVLSMGMSDDYLTAIRFGATHVRVGSAIFGARPAA
ncbi:YggS family pyridoxal phosphate-dependent enzyme [Brevundimonas sp.]|uniref:YggS family pyridoxal phosphate-dependent enzyme n=1 Tax=Brevundimonas sp. TaxID=1871086 RepID=UPI0035B49F92